MEYKQIGDAVLINGDCEEYIKQIPDNCITLIHTDPPYIIHSSGAIGSFMESKGGRKFYDNIINADISDGFNMDVMMLEFERAKT